MKTTEQNSSFLRWGSIAFLCAGLSMSALVSAHSGKDYSRVLGGISIDSGEVAGDISSINGGVDVDDNAKVNNIETVNGGIELGKSVSLSSAKTVNGRITARSNLKVSDSLETVNGRIELDEGADIAKNLATVNGGIMLKQGTVGGDIETVNGNIEIDDTQLKGDLIIRKNGGWFSSGSKPRVEILGNSVIEGDIHLYREVDLKIDDSAKVGKIHRHYQ